MPSMLLFLLASGCATTRGFPANRVGQVELDLETGRALPDTLLPARPVPFVISVVRDDGERLSTADGSLDPVKSRVLLSAQGLELDRTAGTLTPVGDGPWSLTVGYKRRGDLERTQTWTADSAALDGPPDAAVADLRLEASPADEVDGWLLPGSTVAVVVEAEDVYGRVYRTEPYSTVPGAPLHLPWARVQVEGEGMAWQPDDASLLASGDRDQVPAEGYSVVVRLADVEDRASWKADFARRDGPLAEEVTALRWRLLDGQGQEVGDKVEPGSTLSLQAEVDSTDGRTFSTADQVLRLPAEQLLVSVRGGTWAPESGTIRFGGEDEPIILVGRSMSVDVGLVERKDLRTSLTLRPDLVAPVARWLDSQESRLSLHGAAGAAGAAGQPGAAGAAGQDGALTVPATEAAQAGADGKGGGVGADGGDGAAGPELRVFAAEAWTLDGIDRLVVFRVEREGEREYGLKRWEDPPIRLSAGGGDGGTGGAGGVGGTGGRGGDGCLAGAGGDGGAGGAGGKGGNGGDGGTILFVGGRSVLESHFVLTAPGGAGGQAGQGGAGGAAGKAGDTLRIYSASAGEQVVAEGCAAAEPGQPGKAGATGQPGQPGKAGKVERSTDPEAWDHLHDMPDELRRYLLRAPAR